MDLAKTWAIFKKDFGSYFHSPIAYIVVVVYLLVSGGLFLPAFFNPQGMQEATMRPFFGLAPLLFAIFTPAITMRLLAEERSSGTVQILATLPVRDLDVVVGKFFAALGLVAVLLALTLPWAFTLELVGDPDWGPILGGYLGLLLMCGAYVAIGLMASAWTENQIIAFVLGFVICFAFFLMGKVLPLVPDALVPLLEAVSFDHHFQNIARGVVDSRNVIYFLSVTVFCLFVADQALERRKWATS